MHARTAGGRVWFLPPIGFSAAFGWPSCLAVGDLDGDGSQDVAAGFSGGCVYTGHNGWWIGEGVWSFSLTGTPGRDAGTKGKWLEGVSPGPDSPIYLAIGDLDEDGRGDIVELTGAYICGMPPTGQGVPRLKVLATTGATFDYDPCGPPILLGDLDQDGHLDVVAGPLSVFLGNGDGSLRPRTDYPVRHDVVAIGDLNDDGKLDLVTSGSVLLGNGDGTFGVEIDLPLPGAFAIGDFDGDHRADLATMQSDTLSILRGRGDGTFTPWAARPVGWLIPDYRHVPVAIGDFDRDGRSDLALLGWNAVKEGGDDCWPYCHGCMNQSPSVLLGNGDGTFGSATDFEPSTFCPGCYLLESGGGPWAFATGDFNGDGWLDLVAAEWNLARWSHGACYEAHADIFLNAAPIDVAFRLEPHKIKVGAKHMHRRVTGYLQPPAPYTADQIAVSSIRLNGVVAVDSTGSVEFCDRHPRDGIPELSVEFNRVELALALHVGSRVPVVVTGSLGDQNFVGTDTVKVKLGKVRRPRLGEVVTPGQEYPVEYDVSPGDPIQYVALLYSMDRGETWVPDITRQPATGEITWAVPHLTAEDVLLAVVEVEEEGDSSEVVGVLGLSDHFMIMGPLAVGREPSKLELAPIQPSPSAVSARIRFGLPFSGEAELTLHDVQGRMLKALTSGMHSAGWHELVWAGQTDSGGPAKAGIYFVRLRAGGRELTQRLVWLK